MLRSRQLNSVGRMRGSNGRRSSPDRPVNRSVRLHRRAPAKRVGESGLASSLSGSTTGFSQSESCRFTEIVKADCLDRSSLAPALAGVHTAYYLVHSMGSPGKFEQEDRQAAQNFADVARDSGVRRIVFLGGLGEQDQALSAHLRSRHEVADILRSSGIPTVEFRASIVIGSVVFHLK